jgi:hypothetical protein
MRRIMVKLRAAVTGRSPDTLGVGRIEVYDAYVQVECFFHAIHAPRQAARSPIP